MRRIVTACHPVLSTDARQVALTLRLLAGPTTREMARAYLVSEATVAQRIVRAKRTPCEARVPFGWSSAKLGARLAAVLEVIYGGDCFPVPDLQDAFRAGEGRRPANERL